MCVVANPIGVRELRQNLSRYLDRVKDGEVFEVTEHGRPVALLRPLASESDLIARLEAEGLLAQRATARFSDLGPPLPRRPGARPMSEILDEIREDTV